METYQPHRWPNLHFQPPNPVHAEPSPQSDCEKGRFSAATPRSKHQVRSRHRVKLNVVGWDANGVLLGGLVTATMLDVAFGDGGGQRGGVGVETLSVGGVCVVDFEGVFFWKRVCWSLSGRCGWSSWRRLFFRHCYESEERNLRWYDLEFMHQKG